MSMQRWNHRTRLPDLKPIQEAMNVIQRACLVLVCISRISKSGATLLDRLTDLGL